jgi:Fe-S-cluster containining protein
MVESRTRFWSNDTTIEVAHLIEDALETATAYQHHMARYLFEIACLDGLQNLPADGSLPSSFLGYFQKVLELLDESLTLSLGQLRDAGLTVQCRRECSHCCCQMPTGVSTAELIYLYHGTQQSGAKSKFFRRCLEAEEFWVEVFHQETKERAPPGDCGKLTELISKSYRSLEHPCPFLQGEACQIYPYRPLACRIHFSLTPPHWCFPSHFQNAHALGFNLEPAKCVFDALEKVDNRFQLELSDVMVCGLLELTVNIMKFQKIRWF